MRIFSLLGVLILSGCTVGYADKDHFAYVSVLENRKLARVIISRTPTTQRITLGGVESSPDDAAVQALADGIAHAVLQGLLKP